MVNTKQLSIRACAGQMTDDYNCEGEMLNQRGQKWTSPAAAICSDSHALCPSQKGAVPAHPGRLGRTAIVRPRPSAAARRLGGDVRGGWDVEGGDFAWGPLRTSHRSSQRAHN